MSLPDIDVIPLCGVPNGTVVQWNLDDPEAFAVTMNVNGRPYCDKLYDPTGRTLMLCLVDHGLFRRPGTDKVRVIGPAHEVVAGHVADTTRSTP